MRTTKYTNKFKTDYKREKSGQYGRKLDSLLRPIIDLLVDDKPLPKNIVDHSLSGKWADCRDCHIKPDFVMIYRKPDDETIELVRLGSQSELGL